MLKILLFITSLLCCMSALSQVQHYDAPLFFTHIDGRNGLSENMAKTIVQDHLGFIWVGTKNGLNRYDGVLVKHYQVDDYLSGTGNHNISALYESPDHTLWVGTDKGVFLLNMSTEQFTFFSKQTRNGQGVKNWIADIKGDNQGNIWIISPGEGAFLYNTKKHSLSCFRFIPGSKRLLNPQSICIRSNGEVWIGTSLNGIFSYDRIYNTLHQVITDSRGATLAGQDIYTMCDYGNSIALGEHEGKLVKYTPATRLFSDVNAPDVHYKVIRALCFDGEQLYAGTQDGLYIINEKLNQERAIREDPFRSNWLSDNMVYSLYLDRQQNVWIGTMHSGVNCLPHMRNDFICFVPSYTENSLSGKHLRDMLCDKEGNVWISSEDGFLNVFQPKTMTFRNVHVSEYKGGSNRLALLDQGTTIWSGIFKNGLDVISKQSFSVQHYSPRQLGLNEEGSVYSLLKDHTGRVWLGTGAGLYVQDKGMHFKRISALPGIYVLDMAEDRYHRIWIATIGYGVYCVNPATNQIKRYEHQSNDTTSLSSNDVSSITVDHAGNLWFATDRGGVCRFDLKTNKFRTWSVPQGLTDDVSYKILEDRNHQIWFGTNHGIICLDPQTNHIEMFHNSYLLPGNQYNYKSAAVIPGGCFLFGGSDGIVYIDPNKKSWYNTNNKIYIGDVLVDNKEVVPGKGMLETNPILSKKIVLPYNFSNLTLCISTLNYSGMESGNYEYQLEGIDRKWILMNNAHKVTYTRLQPGTYLFKVRNTNNHSQATTLAVVVTPPWWASIPAKIVYLLLFAFALWYAYKRTEARQRRKMALREQQFRETKEKELQISKINFFTNVTHEIRTPLTLINLSVEDVEKMKVSDEALKRNIRSISKNCKRLLNLTNQLLDFRKVDGKGLQPSFVNINVTSFLKDIVDRFGSSLTVMHKDVSLIGIDNPITIPADVEMLTKIMSNLLNNARKYSDKWVRVRLNDQTDYVQIVVENDGALIPDDKKDEIFKPFSRLDSSNHISGTGIGLPLARSLAETLHGSLTVDTLDGFNRFTLQLPKHQQHIIQLGGSELSTNAELPEEPAETVPTASLTNASAEDKAYTVLVVEDNAEMCARITEHLSRRFVVATAQNGKEALDCVKAKAVDIVVTDLMMPVMDGIQFTKLLKDDVDLNYIPVIMLTAKQTMDSQLEGLRAGADAYISKPFSFEHLETQIDTLLANRKRERESFLHKPYLSTEGSSVNPQSKEFLDKATKLIVEHIAESDFNVDRLAEEMCMSRSSLNRKIKGLSGITPIDFIRLIRLKKAAELIKTEGYRVTEVCEHVGFSSPSYFIKLFQKQFGMTPKEFAGKN